MKKVILIISVIASFALSGCGVSVKMPDDPIIFEINKAGEYAYLSVDDKVYVPYCPYDIKYLGDCIGYYDLQGDEYTSGGKIYVYEFIGYPSDEWIIDFDAEGGKDGMILREINTTNIPEGLRSEYEWNN